MLAVGGAHAIAALAYGFDGFEPCDVVVGPGNRWVTAAKQLVAGQVGIDMLAGPSELVVLADEDAIDLIAISQDSPPGMSDKQIDQYADVARAAVRLLRTRSNRRRGDTP